MLKSNMRLIWLAIVLMICSLLLFSAQLWARIPMPPWMADIHELAENAPLVFRGYVLSVIPLTSNAEPGAGNQYIATIHVDRWYRGKGPTEETLQFAYGNFARNGHDCIDFRQQSDWLVFAHEENGQLELMHDCIGALTVSPLLGRDLESSDWPAQMEADFVAGLNDLDSAARIVSIQRLGGLQLPSSGDTLHREIENGNDAESKWAVYAALRTGDISVLPKVKQSLANGDRDLPEWAIASQLQSVTDPAAVPDLIAILQSAPGEMTRYSVLTALGEVLKDPRAVPSLAAHLSDSAPRGPYLALVGLGYITHEEACTLPSEWREQDVEPQISRCKNWWEQTGKIRDWSQN